MSHATRIERSRALARGLAWLLPRQETSGCWPGGYFVNDYPHKTEDVYTT